MSSEILAGADLFREILDAIDNGDGPESFRFDGDGSKRYLGTPTSWAQLVAHSEIRPVIRKPRTRHLIDSSGKRWEWPEPMRTPPKYLSVYYIPYIDGQGRLFLNLQWQNSDDGLTRLTNGLCHATEDAAIQHARALIAASGGEVSDE